MIMDKIITDYHGFIDEAPHSAMIRGMIRMAEDSADDGLEDFAKRVWQTVIADLTERGDFMKASMFARSGNKMIGIAPDDRVADDLMKKAIKAA